MSTYILHLKFALDINNAAYSTLLEKITSLNRTSVNFVQIVVHVVRLPSTMLSIKSVQFKYDVDRSTMH